MNNADKAAVLYNWLENHLNIINTYSQALETIGNYKGNIFYPSEASSGKDKDLWIYGQNMYSNCQIHSGGTKKPL